MYIYNAKCDLLQDANERTKVTTLYELWHLLFSDYGRAKFLNIKTHSLRKPKSLVDYVRFFIRRKSSYFVVNNYL